MNMISLKENERFLLVYERGNDYHCGCCRSTWIETDTYEDAESLIYALEKMSKGDFRPLNVYRIIEDINFEAYTTAEAAESLRSR